MQKLNTHYYDGQLHNRFVELNEYVSKNSIAIIPLNLCSIEITILINESSIDQRTKMICLHILNQLISNSNENFDKSNNIHLHDLLPIVWAIVKKYDASGKCLFLEQLSEIANGMCAQGRVARLLQMVEF
jgi:hypothetical protein